MGKASISIAISGSYNGSAISRAEKALERLALKTSAADEAAGRAWADMGSKAADAGGRIYNAGEQAARAGDMLTTAVTVPLLAVGTAASKTAIDFESSMSRVAGALNDPTANMEQLRELAIETGQETVFSAADAGAAMEELAKGGMSAVEIQGGALATTMDLAAAGSLDLSTAANTVVQAMGAFQLDAAQSSEAANALAGAAAASSADVSDLTQALSQSSAQANAAGWSIQDTTAVLASFADAGVRGSDAGTSLRTMLQRLAAPTGAASSMMEQLGIEVRNSDGSMKDAASIAEELQTALGGVDTATRDAALQTIFGADASRGALIMMNQGREGIEKYTAATNDQEAAQRLANSQMGDTQRAIEEMNGSIETAGISLGTALIPFVTQGANAVGSLASAFSSLDSGTQSTIATLALVAAAAGPVLSVTGRIAQGVGSLVTAFGRVQQTVGVYANALTTTNAAALKAYSANEQLSGALARNPAVKAAGGVEQYVKAVESANSASTAYTQAVRNLNREYSKGSSANASKLSELQGIVQAREAEVQATQGTVQAYQAEAAAANVSTAATTRQAVAMTLASKAGAALKAALPMIAIAGAAAAIGAIATAAAEAAERERNMEKATRGLVEATDDSSISAERGAESVEEYGTSAAEARSQVDELTEKQAELADSFNEMNIEASGQIAQLDYAYQTIQQYANQTGLTVAEQQKLKTAVETVNSMCGTQIQVTDAVNGALADEHGAIGDVNAAIGEYIEKKQQQIEADARQQQLTDLYAQRQENIAALTSAQAAYYDELEQLGSREDYIASATQTLGISAEEAAAAYDASVQQIAGATGLTQAQADLAATDEAMGNLYSQSSAEQQLAEGAAETLPLLVSASQTVQTALSATGGSVEGFATALSNAGISVEDFKTLSEDQLIQLVAAWDGGTGDITGLLEGWGFDVKTAATTAGGNAATGLATGITGGMGQVAAAAAGVGNTASTELGAVQGRTYQYGQGSVTNFASGISSGTGTTSANAHAVANAATGPLSSAQSGAYTSGRHLTSNFASGMSASDVLGMVSGAANTVMGTIQSIMGFSVPEEGPFSGAEKGGFTSGMHLAQNFANGMLDGVPMVSRAANSLMGAASLTGSAQTGSASGQGSAGELMRAVLYELQAIRSEIGPDIARYAPRFPDKREFERMVAEVG